MKDKQYFCIEIKIENDDIDVNSTSSEGFILEQKEKTLLLIALFELKEKIKNNQLNVEVTKC